MSEAIYTPTPYITLVQAPGIPETERKALELHWREAELDHGYTVVLNYECRVDLVETPDSAKLLVTAPGIPVSEVRKLQRQVSKAKKAKQQVDRLIVVNYECRIDAITA